jgi:hypothetical protein
MSERIEFLIDSIRKLVAKVVLYKRPSFLLIFGLWNQMRAFWKAKFI